MPLHSRTAPADGKRLTSLDARFNCCFHHGVVFFPFCRTGFTDVHGRMNDNDCDGRDGGSSGIDSAVGMHGYNTTNNDNGDHDNLNDGEASHHSHNDYSTGGGDAVSEERPIAQRIRRKSIIDHLKAWAFRGKEKAQKAAKGGANDTTDTDNDNDDDDETDSHSSCTSARFERKRADSDSSGYDHDDYRPRSRSRDHRKPGPLDRKRSLNSIGTYACACCFICMRMKLLWL